MLLNCRLSEAQLQQQDCSRAHFHMHRTKFVRLAVWSSGFIRRLFGYENTRVFPKRTRQSFLRASVPSTCYGNIRFKLCVVLIRIFLGSINFVFDLLHIPSGWTPRLHQQDNTQKGNVRSAFASSFEAHVRVRTAPNIVQLRGFLRRGLGTQIRPVEMFQGTSDREHQGEEKHELSK